MAIISTEGLQLKIIEDKSMIIVDTLDHDAYETSHLPGAINIPVKKVKQLAPTLLPDKDAEIVVYCSGPKSPDSENAARALTALGYNNVLELKEGKAGWIEAGYPVMQSEPDQPVPPT